MRVVAEIKSDYESSDVAASVASSLNVDNVEHGNLAVRTVVRGKTVESVVKAEGLSTAFSTIDDLIRNQIAAEESVFV